MNEDTTIDAIAHQAMLVLLSEAFRALSCDGDVRCPDPAWVAAQAYDVANAMADESSKRWMATKVAPEVR